MYDRSTYNVKTESEIPSISRLFRILFFNLDVDFGVVFVLVRSFDIVFGFVFGGVFVVDFVLDVIFVVCLDLLFDIVSVPLPFSVTC